MIPRRFRLPKSRIDYLLRKGKKLGNEYGTVKFLPPAAGKKAVRRFCVIVSAKIEPGAVKRNRLRRQIYEIIRLQCNTRHSPCDIIFIAKPKIKELPFDALQTATIALLKKIPA